MPEDQNENQQEAEGQQQVDPIKNVKAEFDRKLDNVIKQQNEQLQAILAQVTETMRPQQQQQVQPQKSMKELIYEDADAAAALITQQAVAAASRVVDQRVEQSQRATQTVNEVIAVYPEFGQANSEAAALAIKKMSQLPKDQQGNALATKTVMYEAAAELGLVPAKARKQSNDDDSFSVSGGSSRGSGQRSRNSDKSKDVSPDTLEFAQLMGIDISDPKRLEGLKKASQRTKWNKYE